MLYNFYKPTTLKILLLIFVLNLSAAHIIIMSKTKSPEAKSEKVTKKILKLITKGEKGLIKRYSNEPAFNGLMKLDNFLLH